MMWFFNNLILLYSVIGLLVVLLAFLVFLSIRNNKKQMTKKEQDVTPLVEPISAPINEIDSEPKVDLEQMLEQMRQDIDEKSIDSVKKFEDEQEQKSVISYQELIEANKKKQAKENNPQMEDVKQDKTEKNKIEEPKVTPKEKLDESAKRFKSTDFISPIYGRLDSKPDYPTIPNFKKETVEEEIFDEETSFVSDESIFNDYKEPKRDEKDIIHNNKLEETLNIAPLSDEIKKNDEFLNMLKEFRKNLE